MKRAKITFWGVRGSLASAGPQTARYGGNTPCVEISCEDTTIICDSGTGIRPLGLDLVRRARGKKITAALLLSHIHLDHVIGLPFFEPFYQKKNHFTVMTAGRNSKDFKAALKKLISPPYFPIKISQMPARLNFKTFSHKSLKIGPITVGTFKCHHPDGSFAFKFKFPHGRTLVYVSDNEPSAKRHAALVRHLKGADLLIHDAEYSPRQYSKKKGWGHSPYPYPIKLAAEAGIKKLIMFHYEPGASDTDLNRMASLARKLIRRKGYDIDLTLSREGMKVYL